MVIEQLPLPFTAWLPQALWSWGLVVLGLGFFGLVFGYLVAAMRQGPLRALGTVVRVATEAVADLTRMSPRRVRALAWLAVKESIHRLVLVAFGVFVVVLLFAGWYLDETSVNVIELYLSFVMTATSYLVLMLALFLSVFSLPQDITKKTLHTVVTKPVRASEIVLGRILGFVATGTALLAVTGLFSYLFVVRGLNHTHEVVLEDLRQVPPGSREENPVVLRGETGSSQQHRHTLFIYKDGQGRIETNRGHVHALRQVGSSQSPRYEVGPPQMPARVPLYGRLSFFDRQGQPTGTKGINVCDEWTYRQYIEGGTGARAVWRFDGLDPADSPNGLKIELTLQVFRTHKGVIDRPIHGSLILRNPGKGLTSEDIYFEAKEYSTDTHFVSRNLLDNQGNPVDLWQDLVNDGSLEIELSCLDPGQFLGCAQADLYLRKPDASFAANFIKGYLGIWLQMVLVTCLGVMFTTLLNAPVSMLATFAMILGGYFVKDILDLAQGKTYGGGPVESLVRLVTQANVMTELDPGLGRDIAKMADQVLNFILYLVAQVLPNFTALSDIDYVAEGYNVPGDVLLAHAATTLGFLVAAVVAGYFFLKTREVAK